jgi:hypothetical protein
VTSTRTEAFTDPNLFGHYFDPQDSWAAHLVVIMALDGLPLSRQQKRIFRSMTKRRYRLSLADALKILLLVWGRRSGKSVLTAFLSCYEAYFVDHRRYLKPGETGVVQVVATDRKQAAIILKYCEALFDHSPVLNRAIVRRTSDTLELDNGIAIQVASCSIRSVRGYTCVAVIAEESPFWRSDESANPDRDVINALMATMATVPTGKCFMLGSPGGAAGYTYELFRDNFGKNSKQVLVFQAGTREMNPTIEQSYLDSERERDPESYKSEFEAQFRSGRSTAFEQSWIDNCLVNPDRPIPRSEHLNWRYFAAFDASGGMSDAASLAISHIVPGTDIVIVDFIRTWPAPHSPEDVVAEACQYLREYGCSTVTGDAYAASWVSDAFSRHSIHYRRSELNRSQAYLELIPLMVTGKIEAPDRTRLRQQLGSLIRKPRSGSRDVIDHPVGQHDDEANVLALVCVDTSLSTGRAIDVDMLTASVEPHLFGSTDADLALERLDLRNPAPWSF